MAELNPKCIFRCRGPLPWGMTGKRIDAGRFLAQATLGADRSMIDSVAKLDFETWIDQQFAEPPTFVRRCCSKSMIPPFSVTSLRAGIRLISRKRQRASTSTMPDGFNPLEGDTFRTYGAGRYVYRLEIASM